MRIPGYRATKVQVSDEYGKILVLRDSEGETDSVVFAIDSDGEMELSDLVRNAIANEDLPPEPQKPGAHSLKTMRSKPGLKGGDG